MSRFNRPNHIKDNNQCHIQYGEDPKPYLREYGYCIVENVFTNEECQDYINGCWDWLEGLDTGIDRNNNKTWNNNNWVLNYKQGMISHTVSHSEFLWKVREHDNVINLYNQIYNTDQLLVSFDGITISRPPELGYTRASKTSWIHTDQNIIDDDLNNIYDGNDYSVQGILNFNDSNDKDGCLLIWVGSHLLHTKLFEHNNKKPKNNWYVLSKEDINWLLDNNIQFLKVNAPKGSVILFDSRCFHSGYPNQLNRDNPSLRYVAYVTMAPAIRASKKDINKKIKSIKEGRTTNHYPANHIKIFPYPQTYGKNYPYLKRKENIPDYNNWSDKRKKLSGLLPYIN
jgi:ectoine hydroxylase-related dioxygenase (phytanoyl-CoA dioxygenase family)